MEAIINTSKNKVMKHHIYYIKYALRFADMQIPELVTIFNRQTGLQGWSGMRAYHDSALTEEFTRRGIDVSAVHNDQSTSFARPVRYDLKDNKLDTIN